MYVVVDLGDVGATGDVVDVFHVVVGVIVVEQSSSQRDGSCCFVIWFCVNNDMLGGSACAYVNVAVYVIAGMVCLRGVCVCCYVRRVLTSKRKDVSRIVSSSSTLIMTVKPRLYAFRRNSETSSRDSGSDRSLSFVRRMRAS